MIHNNAKGGFLYHLSLTGQQDNCLNPNIGDNRTDIRQIPVRSVTQIVEFEMQATQL
jgi:hypothetical protein